jgi:hypothetical protein
MYRTTILPAALYAYESLSLTLRGRTHFENIWEKGAEGSTGYTQKNGAVSIVNTI